MRCGVDADGKAGPLRQYGITVNDLSCEIRVACMTAASKAYFCYPVLVRQRNGTTIDDFDSPTTLFSDLLLLTQTVWWLLTRPLWSIERQTEQVVLSLLDCTILSPLTRRLRSRTATINVELGSWQIFPRALNRIEPY
jgi:hypothetical protein